MNKKWKYFSVKTLLKWTALLVIVFALSLPVTAEESQASNTWTVSVAKGYLALRTAKAYDASNEIGELYTGDTEIGRAHV